MLLFFFILSLPPINFLPILKKILIIQTAFIGDVVLATVVLEKLRVHYPAAAIDFLMRRGNEGLLKGHPFVHEVILWDKKTKKYTNLWNIILEVRKTKYDLVVNLQRFASTGLISALSRAKEVVGFDKNPLAIFYTKKIKHQIGSKENPIHETERNLALIQHLTDDENILPKLYPQPEDFAKVNPPSVYYCMAPTSVWFTKQWPQEKWIALCDKLNPEARIYLLGGPGDQAACQEILGKSKHNVMENMAGKLSFLESVALMKGATMNFVNDSAPLHFASAVNAPVTAIYCSTIPAFGFGPLSENSRVVETGEALACRPCGLHGKKACPEGHFRCAEVVGL